MKKRKYLRIVLGLFLTMILIVFAGMLYLSNGLKDQITLSGIKIENIPDGKYNGTYVHGRWTNTLTVFVTNHKISDIVLEHDVVFRKDGLSEEVFDRVINAQDTKIDVVSGATITTKAYLKSIEIALQSE